MKKFLAFVISMAVGGAAVWFGLENREEILKTVRGWLDEMASEEKAPDGNQPTENAPMNNTPEDNGAVGSANEAQPGE